MKCYITFISFGMKKVHKISIEYLGTKQYQKIRIKFFISNTCSSSLLNRSEAIKSTNSLNKYINSFGVITTYGDYINLFVNGTDVGLYLAVENIDKSLLERDFQITNYAIYY